MRDKCEELGIEKPTQSFDPNHWKKVFRGNDKGSAGAASLMAIKKRLKITNVLGADDQTRMVELLATCVKQHRETADATFFKAATWNVFNHVFGRHADCHKCFGTDGKAPCQSAGHLPKFKLRLYYNKVPRAAEVEAEMQTLFQKMTTDPMIKGILGSTDTQRNESINNVRGSIRSKRGHCAGHCAGSKRGHCAGVPPGRHQVERGAPRVDAGGARPPGRARRRGRVGRAWPGVPRPRVER